MDPTLEQEERAMKSGRGGMIAAAIVVLLAVGGGVGWMLMHGGPSAEGQVGRQVNGLRSDHFDRFWACALPRANIREIGGNQQLEDAVHERAQFSPSRYAQLLRTECQHFLDEHGPLLDAIIVPDDLRTSIEELRAALRTLREATAAYATYLGGVEAYDREDEVARAHVSRIARGWFDYRVAIGHVNDGVRAHVE